MKKAHSERRLCGCGAQVSYILIAGDAPDSLMWLIGPDDGYRWRGTPDEVAEAIERHLKAAIETRSRVGICSCGRRYIATLDGIVEEPA